MSGNYIVPTMEEIQKIPFNGFNVVSTFSGGGGSCLGYRMAGYKVLYANEFIEEARKTYRANFKSTYVDARDIREVSGEQILSITKLKKGEIDIFDGSPPCSAFSSAGSREKGWGKVKAYSDSKQRVDDLFFEYTRLLKELQPKIFIAENVSGLVKGTAKGYFKEILKEMKDCGYNVSARLLNAKYLGVPQSRERIIFCGVRKDLSETYNITPVFPTPINKVISLKEAFYNLKNDEDEVNLLLKQFSSSSVGDELRKLTKNPKKPISSKKYFNLTRTSLNTPCPTVTQLGGSAAGVCHPLEDRRFTIMELKRITSLPDDFILTGIYRQQWERVGRMVPPIMMYHISRAQESVLRKIKENEK